MKELLWGMKATINSGGDLKKYLSEKARSFTNEYRRKLDQLNKQFLRRIKPPDQPKERARALFNWLWERKPSRYKPRGPFRLNDVIDAELSQGSWAVGNCLGLTLLYHCLLRKMGIHAGALYLENAFDMGPHVLTLLQTEATVIDIENILPDGFDYKGHLDNPSRTTWGDKELVADIYHSLGNECFEKGKFDKALDNYERAIHLNPHYEKAHLNKSILLEKVEEKKVR